ncbi:hypothetical protein MO973_19640 [Paenibacillus sp. TRM 82003]|nr:hypothetical protein [Paenibacillus sp. TRM 82003]
MHIDDIKRALSGYHGEINNRIHYSEYIRRMGPTWLTELIEEREYMTAQLQRINDCVVPGLAAHIAGETLERIGEVGRGAELYSLNGRTDKDAPETRASV